MANLLSASPPQKDHSSRNTLDYDDQDGYDDRGRSHYTDRDRDKDARSSRNDRYDSGRSPQGGGRYSDSRRDGSRSRRAYGPPGKAIVVEDVPEDATERDVCPPLPPLLLDASADSPTDFIRPGLRHSR
jgi:hypothetical protein